jgi:hypothetical protein
MYIITAEQKYDLTPRERVSGKLMIEVSFEVTNGNDPVATAKGNIVIELEKLPGASEGAIKRDTAR